MFIDIRIDGVTALICNRFTDAAAEAATNGSRTSSANSDKGTPRDQAEPKLYLDLDGKPCVPQPNLLRCIVDGGKFHKIGKAQVTTAKSSLLYACLDIDGVTIRIEHTQPWRVDTRAVRIPATGGRILAHRPMFDDWALSFTAMLDTSLVSARLFRQIVDDAGQRIGLGDFRPSTKGPFGKFKVTAWSERQEALPVAA